MNNGKLICALALAVLAVGPLCPQPLLAADQPPYDTIEALRADLRANRTAVVAERMQFTPKEGEGFWPLYRSYRDEMDRATDNLVKLLLEYTDQYPNLTSKQAAQMLDEYLKTEKNLLKVKEKYFKKFQKVLPATKVFRFAQLDNRLDLGIRVGLASFLPILATGDTRPPTQ